jgi:hypothetical protein
MLPRAIALVPPDDAQRRELLIDLADAQAPIGELERAHAVAAEALAAARAAGRRLPDAPLVVRSGKDTHHEAVGSHRRSARLTLQSNRRSDPISDLWERPIFSETPRRRRLFFMGRALGWLSARMSDAYRTRLFNAH